MTPPWSVRGLGTVARGPRLGAPSVGRERMESMSFGAFSLQVLTIRGLPKGLTATSQNSPHSQLALDPSPLWQKGIKRHSLVFETKEELLFTPLLHQHLPVHLYPSPKFGYWKGRGVL